jgi:hypothetical protein
MHARQPAILDLVQLTARSSLHQPLGIPPPVQDTDANASAAAPKSIIAATRLSHRQTEASYLLPRRRADTIVLSTRFLAASRSVHARSNVGGGYSEGSADETCRKVDLRTVDHHHHRSRR